MIALRLTVGGIINIVAGVFVIGWLSAIFMDLAARLTGDEYGWPQISFMSAYPDHIRNGYLMFVAAVVTFIILSSGVFACLFGASPGKALLGIRYVDTNENPAPKWLLLIRMGLILVLIGFVLLVGPILGFVFGPAADLFSLSALIIGAGLCLGLMFPTPGQPISWVNRVAGIRPVRRAHAEHV